MSNSNDTQLETAIQGMVEVTESLMPPIEAARAVYESSERPRYRMDEVIGWETLRLQLSAIGSIVERMGQIAERERDLAITESRGTPLQVLAGREMAAARLELRLNDTAETLCDCGHLATVHLMGGGATCEAGCGCTGHRRGAVLTAHHGAAGASTVSP